MPSLLPGETGRLSDLLADSSVVILAKLSKNPIDVNSYPINLASMIECDFPGYAAVVVNGFSMCDPLNDALGEGVSDPLVWRSGEGIVYQEIHAVYLTYQKGNAVVRLLKVMALPSPIIFEKPHQSFEYQVRVTSVNVPDPI